MEIFKDFGFQPEFFVAQIINFLILAFIFKKYLYKPVLKVLKDRQTKIKQGIEDSEKAGIALATAEEQKDEILKRASQEAERIIESTRNEAQELKNSLMDRAKEDADRIIADGHEQAKIEFEKADAAAKIIALDLSKKVLERILDDLFTKDEKAKILKKNIQKLELND